MDVDAPLVKAAAEQGGRAPVICDAVAALGDLPPEQLGPALAALAVPTLTGTETVLVLIAAKRLRNHADGLIYQFTRETLRRTDDKFGVREDPKSAASASAALAGVNEVRAALDLSRERAIGLCATARRLDGPLWPLQEALIDGRLDQERVRIFDRETAGLSAKTAEAVAIDLSLPAESMSPRELTDLIRRHAIQEDPQAAQKREKAALAGRRVQVHTQSDGTATIAGKQLPVIWAAIAAERLDALARQARRAGHPGSVGNLRAEIFLGKLSGRFDGLDDEDLITVLLAEAQGTQPDPDKSTMDEPAAAGAEQDDSGSEHDDESDRDYDDATWVRLDWLRYHSPHNDDTDTDTDADADTEADVDVDAQADADADVDAEAGMAEEVCFGSAVDRDGPARRAHGKGLRLAAELTTIAGLNQHPSKLMGWSTLHPDLARRVASTPGATWHYVLLDADGTLLDVADLQQRPVQGWAPGPTPDPDTSDYHGLECWLTVTHAELHELQQDPPPGWDTVIDELARRIATRRGGPPNGDPRTRIPSAALRRWIAVRDGMCVFLTCPTPAHQAEIDHTLDHALGGDTVDDNLGPLCNPDHTAKHAEGWKCYQLRPGNYLWISPLQIKYLWLPPEQPGQPPRLERIAWRATPPDTYQGIPAEQPPPF